MSRIEPNPHSPYADADPQYRHIFPSSIFFPDPEPGVLALAGCERLAVVPERLTDAHAGDGALPDGLCPACLAAMRGEELPLDARPVTQCRECDMRTEHDGLCALCRQQKHEAWWPTHNTTVSETPTTVQLTADLEEIDAPAVGTRDEIRAVYQQGIAKHRADDDYELAGYLGAALADREAAWRRADATT